MKPDNRKPADDSDSLTPELASLLRMAGLGLPKTEAEVAAAEKWLAENPMRLPASLLDPEAVFRRASAGTKRFGTKRQTAATTENLARAAREGAEIPPDVEKRMREDREKAERDRKPKDN